MPRNMSFMLTTEQARNRTKTVTHRLGWWHLKPGDIFQQVEKAMGLKRGEKVVKIHLCRVISIKHYTMSLFSKADCDKEGFPGWSRWKFMIFFAKANKCHMMTPVNRIEFEYLD